MLKVNEEIKRNEVAQLCNYYLFRAPVYDDGTIKLPFRDVVKAFLTPTAGNIPYLLRRTLNTHFLLMPYYQ